LGSALQSATRLPGEEGARLISAAEHAFVSGIHFASITGAVLAVCAAVLVIKFLPRHIAQHGALHGPIEALEDAAELGIAGIPPVFADTGTTPSSNGSDDAVLADSTD
jgi:hypothetical protein